jgi:hypothetical protein
MLNFHQFVISRKTVLGSVTALLLALASGSSLGQSAVAKPVLVELFTSEGCSSCPPADALLRTLDSTQPVAGVQLIVLGEHVDYWDDLGWKDTYSAHAFTPRQQAYAERLRLASPYTPQMVVDGNFQFLGSDRELANQAFEKARDLPKVAVRISAIRIENGNLLARIETGPLPAQADVFVALALDHAQSQVLRGENGGHRLEHVAVVRTLRRVGTSSKGQAFSRDVSLTVNSPGTPYHLVAFVQESNQGRILGAAVEPVQK